MGLAKQLDAAIDLLLSDFVTSKSAMICSALVPIALAGVTIYLILIGFSVARGDSDGYFRTTLWKVFRISVILGIALNVGEYQTFVINGLDSLGAGILEAMSGMTSLAEQLDDAVRPFYELGQQFWSDATTGFWPNFALLFAAALVSIAQTFLFSVALGFYILAKVALALTLAIGPIFILCAIWPSTQNYAENWLGQTLNYILLKVLVSASIVMLTSFASQFAAHIAATKDTANVVNASAALLICCVVLAIVILRHPELATALVGGASISGIGRTIVRTLLRTLQPSSPKEPKANTNAINRIVGTQNSTKNSIRPPTPLYHRHTLEQLRNFK